MSTITVGPDGRARCAWCTTSSELLAYHDSEWGFPVADDTQLFEKLSLESFQSGLSWRTILQKRENFLAAFENFDFRKVAQFDDAVVARLLANEGIVRHRGKIEAVISNASCAGDMVDAEGSLAAFFWRFEQKVNDAQPQSRPTSSASEALSKELRKRGWKFVGPTTVYAFMKAAGLVNGHAVGCFLRPEVEKARRGMRRPI